MKFQANWRFKSLNSLEKTNWGEPSSDNYLVNTVHRLRKVPLNEYTVEDLRIMIGQGLGLQFLIPLAIEQLTQNLFAEGDYYEGDLLQMVLNVEEKYWDENKDNGLMIFELIKERIPDLDVNGIKYSKFFDMYGSTYGK